MSHLVEVDSAAPRSMFAQPAPRTVLTTVATPTLDPPLTASVGRPPLPLRAPDSRTRVFTNPVGRGADPWITRRGDTYYYCGPVQDRAIAIYTSRRLTHRGQRKIVWTAPRHAWNSHLLWAPELHWLDGHWYIYYTASAGPLDNASHRVGVLESATENALGPYIDQGVVYTGDDPAARRHNRWAIDATILERQGQRYLLWSGWPDERDVQYLYIAPLETPWQTAGPRVRICDNADFVWERVGDDPRARGLNEGPQVLQRDGRLFIVYSCSSSWQPTYKLGLLELGPNGNPLCPADWRKHPQPVFQSTGTVFGVGHACFVTSPDQREDWIVYHAKLSRRAGWERAVCVQRFFWRADGLPDFGQPLSWRTPLEVPSGEPDWPSDAAGAIRLRSRARARSGTTRVMTV